MELRAHDVVVTLSVGKSRNYQKVRIRYVTVTSCVSRVMHSHKSLMSNPEDQKNNNINKGRSLSF